MRFIPRQVMVGFVNALAILVFIAQFPELVDVPWLVYPLLALALAIIFGLPRLTTAVPAPLVAIVVLTLFTVLSARWFPRSGTRAHCPTACPHCSCPSSRSTFETLQVIAPYALAMAFVGLLESLMTAKLVDDVTDTRSNKTREAWGQGVANLVTGFFGGMGGCAMIGQTMVNVKGSGARTRISTFLAGASCWSRGGLRRRGLADPDGRTGGRHDLVSVATFDWHGIRPSSLSRMPKSETAVMVMTVVATVVRKPGHRRRLGVLSAMVLFARRVAHFATVQRHLDPSGDRHLHDPRRAVLRLVERPLHAVRVRAGSRQTS